MEFTTQMFTYLVRGQLFNAFTLLFAFTESAL